MKRILFATIGSLGDLHPCLALGLELRRRGHAVTIASTPHYRAKVEALGLDFRPLRPNWDPSDPELISQCEDLKRGPEILIRRLILPHLRDTFADLMAAATEPGNEAEMMIAGELVYAAPLVAEKLDLPWASAILSPTSFFSAYDPSLLVNAPQLYRLRRAGRLVNRAILDLGRLSTRSWWGEIRALRREHGLRQDCDPLMRDKFSSQLVLVLFSRALAQPQPDWPANTIQPGFVFFDGQTSQELGSSALPEFLAAGSPPIVFTLGSTAVHNPGNFYEASIEAARRIGRRAILLGAKPGALSKSIAASPDVLALAYAPYSQLFARAAVLVHQGGSGTTGQAMRAGRPMLFVPYGWDQPDNAARVERLGIALTVARAVYSAETAAAALRQLLNNPKAAARAACIADEIAREDALHESCDAIEACL